MCVCVCVCVLGGGGREARLLPPTLVDETLCAHSFLFNIVMIRHFNTVESEHYLYRCDSST